MDMGISMNMNMIIVRETGKETTRMYNPNALNPFCQPYNVPCYHGLFPYNNGIGRLETTQIIRGSIMFKNILSQWTNVAG